MLSNNNVIILVEKLDVGPGEEDGFCKTDWLSLPSCVPERGTRICGNTTGQICKCRLTLLYF